MDAPHHCRIIEGKIRPCVCFVDQNRLCHLEHQRVLQRLIISLRNREDFNIQGRSYVLFCRAHEISDILKKKEIKFFLLSRLVCLRLQDAVQCLPCHLRRHRTLTAGVYLNGANSGSGHFLCIHRRINVCLHHADSVSILQHPGRAQKDRCFPGPRRCHYIQQQDPLPFQKLPCLLGQLFLLCIYTFIDFNHTNTHFPYHPRTGSPISSTRYITASNPSAGCLLSYSQLSVSGRALKCTPPLPEFPRRFWHSPGKPVPLHYEAGSPPCTFPYQNQTPEGHPFC